MSDFLLLYSVAVSVSSVISDTCREGAPDMEYFLAFALIVMVIIAYIEK